MMHPSPTNGPSDCAFLQAPQSKGQAGLQEPPQLNQQQLQGPPQHVLQLTGTVLPWTWARLVSVLRDSGQERVVMHAKPEPCSMPLASSIPNALLRAKTAGSMVVPELGAFVHGAGGAQCYEESEAWRSGHEGLRGRVVKALMVCEDGYKAQLG